MLLDTSVRFAYDFVRRGISSRIGEYRHADQRIEDYVNQHVMPGIRRSIREVLSAIYYGLSVGELIFEPAGSDIHLRRIHVAAPAVWYGGSVSQDPATGEVDYIYLADGREVPVNSENGQRQLVVYSYRSDFNNPYGQPSARTAYAAWFIKSRLQKFEAIGLEAFGVPPVIFQTSGDGDDLIAKYLSVGANKALAIGADDKVVPLTTAYSSSGSPFGETIRRLDGYIFNAFYMPALTALESEFSTRAQATVHKSVYELAETDIVREVVEQVVMAQIIEPILALQFGVVDDPGLVVIRDPAPPERKEQADIAKALKEIGVLDTSLEEQVVWLGSQFEIPVEELLAKVAAQSASKPQEAEQSAPSTGEPQAAAPAVGGAA